MLKRVLLIVLATIGTAVVVFAASLGGSMIDVASLKDSHDRVTPFMDEGARFTAADGSNLRAESQNGDAALKVRIVALETNVSWIQTTMREVVAELKDVSRRLNKSVDRLEEQNGRMDK